MAEPLSSTVRTIFADLIQKVQTAGQDGTVYTHRQGDVAYLYLRRRVGSRRRDSYLGRADDPDVNRQTQQLAENRAQAAERRQTVRLLRGHGLAAPDAVMGPLLGAIADAGLFGAGALLVGTGAYLHMEGLVGCLLPRPTLMTDDLDLATLDLAMSASPPAALEAILQDADASFSGVMQLDPREPSSRFINAAGYLVDIVTPTLRRDDRNPMPLANLSAGAAPLPYLRWLIADPIETASLWGSGVLVRVPQPPRFAVHKLILAQKRLPGTRHKRGKDLAQAAALMQALDRSDPFALEDALDDARAHGKTGWSDPIDRSLAEIARGLHNTR